MTHSSKATSSAAQPAASNHDPDGAAAAVFAHPALRGFSDQHLGLMAEGAELADFQPGSLIFKQGDAAGKFYLIVWGSVSLTHAGLKRNVLIQTLEAGEALGWSWMFPPYAWHFNATATAPTRLIVLDGERLRRLCGENHDFSSELLFRIAQLVIERLQTTRRKLLKLSGDT